MEEKIVKIDPFEFGLDENQAQEVEKAFMPKIVERDGLKEVYTQLLTQEITPLLCNEAKNLRNKLVKVRTGIAEIHKTQKSFFLAAGRYVDAWKNKETLPVTQMEEKLTEIEEYYIRIEQAKIVELQTSRASEIAQYQDEFAFIPDNLGTLADDVYANYLLGVKTAFEQKKAAAEEAKKAEEKRIADEKAENERIRIENEKLKKEREILEAENKKREAKIEAERKAREAEETKQRIEREEKERKEREANEAILKAEREKLAEAQRQLEAKIEADRKAKEAEAERAENELNKGDSEKVKDLIVYLESAKTKFSFKSKKNQKMYSDVSILIDKIITHIEK
jgi:hypothetical protein